MNIIEIAGDRYEVRKYLGVDQIHVEGVWLTGQQFADYLIDQQKSEHISQVIQLGITNYEKNKP